MCQFRQVVVAQIVRHTQDQTGTQQVQGQKLLLHRASDRLGRSRGLEEQSQHTDTECSYRQAYPGRCQSSTATWTEGHLPETPTPTRTIRQEATQKRTQHTCSAKSNTKDSQVRGPVLRLCTQSNYNEASRHDATSAEARYNPADNQSRAIRGDCTDNIPKLKNDNGNNKSTNNRKEFVLRRID